MASSTGWNRSEKSLRANVSAYANVPSFANAFAINIPVASRNYDETFVEQLFGDLIDKALSYDFEDLK